MAEKTFQPGDVVQLASGGPSMTVVGPGEDAGHLLCLWFDKDEKKQADEFPAVTLKEPPPPTKRGVIETPPLSPR